MLVRFFSGVVMSWGIVLVVLRGLKVRLVFCSIWLRMSLTSSSAPGGAYVVLMSIDIWQLCHVAGIPSTLLIASMVRCWFCLGVGSGITTARVASVIARSVKRTRLRMCMCRVVSVLGVF